MFPDLCEGDPTVVVRLTGRHLDHVPNIAQRENNLAPASSLKS
jgi:hypothetical protein